jgi:hypothetical protein
MCVPPIGVPTTPETESKESEGGPERGQQEPLRHGLPGRTVFHIVVGAENS